MRSRKKFLLTTLALSFIGMVAYIFAWAGGSFEGLITFSLFGAVLFVIAYVGLKGKEKAKSKPSLPKVAIACVALAFALLTLVTLIGMFLVGDRAFDILFGQYSAIIWVLSALAISPFVYRKLQ